MSEDNKVFITGDVIKTEVKGKTIEVDKSKKEKNKEVRENNTEEIDKSKR